MYFQIDYTLDYKGLMLINYSSDIISLYKTLQVLHCKNFGLTMDF